jgi:hypothetical protein
MGSGFFHLKCFPFVFHFVTNLCDTIILLLWLLLSSEYIGNIYIYY